MIEWHELGLQPEHLNPKGKSVKEPSGVMIIDRCVGRLPKRHRRCLVIEYFQGGSLKQKAARAHVTVHDYRSRVKESLWVIQGKIEGF